MEKIMGIIRKVRGICWVSAPDYFIKEQNRTYSREQILKSLRYITAGTRFSDDMSLRIIVKHLHCILYYVCNSHAYDRHINTFIQTNQQSLIISTIQILRLYLSYLKRIVPTNATYFHFLRDNEFYFHYIVVRYVLIVGDSHHLKNISRVNIYSRISLDLKKSIFSLLIEWLYDLIDYRNSAIYVKNTTIEHLISSTFILICGLLGPSEQNTFSLYIIDHGSKKDLFNKLMFISIYILCHTINKNKRNKYYLVSMSINCLRKMLVHGDIPDIEIFIPSYFYVDMIGFIHCPLTYEIVMRVLVCFLNQGYERERKLKQREKQYNHQQQHCDNQRINHSQNEHYTEQLFFVSPLTEINIWGVINLIIDKYGTYNKRVLESFLTKIIPSIKPQSLVRAYCVKIIKQLNLQHSNYIISNFYKYSQYDYLVNDKILTIDLLIRNFRDFMQTIYSTNVQQAVMQKQVVLTTQKIFTYLVQFNTSEIKDYVDDRKGEGEWEKKGRREENVEDIRRNDDDGNVVNRSQEQNIRCSAGDKDKQELSGIEQVEGDMGDRLRDPRLQESQFYEQRNKIVDIYQNKSSLKEENRRYKQQLDVEVEMGTIS